MDSGIERELNETGAVWVRLDDMGSLSTYSRIAGLNMVAR